MQQPCSNVVKGVVKLDIEKHREQIRRLVAEAPDEPTICEFKEVLSYATPKEKAELVKDVSSFANADLEILGGHGYIIFGISNDGETVGIGPISGDPASDVRQIVNGNLGRPVMFEYIACDVDGKAGGKNRVAAIVVSDSRRRPHVVSRDIKERRNQKDRFWLRKGEVWVRKTGGREPASAEDLDTMYEGKLRTLVDERVQPLRDRIERLEEDLREQKSVLPELGFGLAVNGAGPSPVGRPYPILDNLIGIGWIRNEIEWAESRHAAAKKAESGHFRSSTLGPSASHYADYKLSLESWLQELEQLLVVDFALINTGHAPAQDVEVVLEVPADLRPRGDLPKRPQRPRDIVLRPQAAPAPRAMLSKQTAPDSLIGPRIRDTSGLGIAQAVWEVGKLYHDRPLLTHSDTNEEGGLLISSEDYGERLSHAGGEVQLDYVVRAANVPEAERGALILR